MGARVRMACMRRLGGLVIAVLLTAVLPAAPAEADGDELMHQFGDGAQRATSVTIHGRANGHGHGLSQYGAYFRAKAGHTYRQILDFYYPGTELGHAGGRVRVLLTKDTTRDLVVLDRDGLTVTALSSGRTWRPKVAAKRWRIDSTGDGTGSVISYKTRTWTTWRTVVGEAEFGAGGKPLTLVTPVGEVEYRGVLRSAAPTDGERDRDTVNVLRLDAYLKGVVPQEMPALWGEHAVRSQAVAARTYAAYERADVPRSRYFDVWDTTRSQVYGGESAEHPASNAAIAATAHEVVTYAGELAFAQFSSSNGGWTTQGQVHGEDVPYLPSQEDTFDDAYQEPDGDWNVTLTAEQVIRHWAGLGDLESITVDERDANGKWVVSLTVSGSDSSVSVSGERFASFLGLRSHFFDDPQVS